MRFYIFNNVIPTEKGMSGSDRRALEYSRFFLANGHSVTLILPKVGLRRYDNPGFKFIVTDINPASRKPSLMFMASRILAANKACRNLRIEPNDVIYSTSDLLADSVPAIKIKKSNPQAKLICGLHLLAPHPLKGFRNAFTSGIVLPKLKYFYYYYSQNLIISRLKRYASLVLVSNELDKNKLIRKGFSEERILVAYGAVDTDAVSQAVVLEKKYDAVFLGRIHEQKGFKDLLEVVKKVSRQKDDFRVALICDALEKDIIGILHKLAIQKNVVFFGFKDGIEKFIIMKESKLLIFPSYFESFGMVICEAMSCGLPVVAYDLPVYRDIFTGGMLKISIGDMEGMARNILNLLRNDNMLRELSESALEIAKKFNWEKTASAILNAIRVKPHE